MSAPFISSIINPFSSIIKHIKICENVENQGHGFTSQKKIDAVLEYSKVPITIQSYSKAHSYAKYTVAPLDHKDKQCARRPTAAADATATISKDVPGLKTNHCGTFTLDGKSYPRKAFVPEEIYLGRLPKFFRDFRQEKKKYWSTKSDETSNAKNCWDKVRDFQSLKAVATKTYPKAGYNDDTRSVFSDLTFIVTAAPTTDKAYSTSTTTGKAIPEDTTIKGIFSAAGARIQVSADAALRSVDIITVEIPKSQVAILAQKGANIVYQGGNSYSMIVMMLSTLVPNQCCASKVYRNNLNGESNPPYILNSPTYGYNAADPNPETCPSSGFLDSPTSLGEHNGYVDFPRENIDDSDEP